MSLDENKAIARRFIQALNPQNLSALDDLVATDYVDHTHQVQRLEVVKQLIEQERKDFSDFILTIEDIIAEGDRVWVHTTETATHTGKFQGLAKLTSFYIF